MTPPESMPGTHRGAFDGALAAQFACTSPERAIATDKGRLARA
jgi:hypothetical protein